MNSLNNSNRKGQKDCLSRGLSVIAILISFGSFWYTCQQHKLTSKSLKIHIKPEVVCTLVPPLPRTYTKLVLNNNSPISAMNLSVNYITLAYNKLSKQIDGMDIGFIGSFVLTDDEKEREATIERFLQTGSTGDQWLYKTELAPNESIGKAFNNPYLSDKVQQIDSYSRKDRIIVLNFELTYYRDTDGQKFEKVCRYYVEGNSIYTPEEFRTRDYYEKMDSLVVEYLNLHKRFSREIYYKRTLKRQ